MWQYPAILRKTGSNAILTDIIIQKSFGFFFPMVTGYPPKPGVNMRELKLEISGLQYARLRKFCNLAFHFYLTGHAFLVIGPGSPSRG